MIKLRIICLKKIIKLFAFQKKIWLKNMQNFLKDNLNDNDEEKK